MRRLGKEGGRVDWGENVWEEEGHVALSCSRKSEVRSRITRSKHDLVTTFLSYSSLLLTYLTPLCQFSLGEACFFSIIHVS